MKNNDRVKNIQRSWWGGWVHSNKNNHELLDFHLLDNASVAFNVLAHGEDFKSGIESRTELIPAFEAEFGLSMFYLLNS